MSNTPPGHWPRSNVHVAGPRYCNATKRRVPFWFYYILLCCKHRRTAANADAAEWRPKRRGCRLK